MLIQTCLTTPTTGCGAGANSVGAALAAAQSTFQTAHTALAGAAIPASSFGGTAVAPPVVTPTPTTTGIGFYVRTDVPGTAVYLNGAASYECSWSGCPTGVSCGIKITGTDNGTVTTWQMPSSAPGVLPVVYVPTVFAITPNATGGFTYTYQNSGAGTYSPVASWAAATAGDNAGYCTVGGVPYGNTTVTPTPVTPTPVTPTPVTPTPVTPTPVTPVLECQGNGSVVCLKTDGTLIGVGAIYGGSTEPIPFGVLPYPIPAFSGVSTFDSNINFYIAVKTDGTVWTWSPSNVFGNVSAYPWVSPPSIVSGVVGAVDAKAGTDHAIVLKADGTVWAFGNNDVGQFGDGTNNTPANLSISQVVPGLTAVRAIAANAGGSMALKTDGTVWTWGSNMSGQLGDPNMVNSIPTTPLTFLTSFRFTPGIVTGLTGVVAIASRSNHSLALKSDGTVWAWGGNSGGQLGRGQLGGTLINTSIPVQVAGLAGVVAIDAGYLSSVAVKSDGTGWTWGVNKWYGQLGNGTLIYSSIPVQVPGLTGVVAVYAGGTEMIAKKSDGTIWTWGNDPITLHHVGVIGNVLNTLPVVLTGF